MTQFISSVRFEIVKRLEDELLALAEKHGAEPRELTPVDVARIRTHMARALEVVCPMQDEVAS